MYLSNEQSIIIDEIKNNKNIRCNSCAGSGKTTTIQNIIQSYKEKRFVILTYNTILKNETIEKIKEENYECHTFHSFGYHYYSKKCINDKALNNIIKSNMKPSKKINFDILIIDESQDLDHDLLYNFCVKIIKDKETIQKETINKEIKEEPLIQVCLFGDKRQAINQFRGADENIFLNTKFEEVKDLIYPEWIDLKLTYSFRITKHVSNFINNNIDYIDKSYKINSNKEGSKIRYISTNDISLSVVCEIFKYLNLGYKQDDIFIISPSVKLTKNTNILNPLLQIQRTLTYAKLNIEIVSGVDKVKDIKVFKNKIVLSSIHGTKGLERKVVILLKFDASYFMFYDKTCDMSSCPNTIYTALTRSKEQLSLIKGCGYIKSTAINDFEFINKRNIESSVDYFVYNFHSFYNIIELYKTLYPNITTKDNKKNIIVKCSIHNSELNISKYSYLSGRSFCNQCKIPLYKFDYKENIVEFLKNNLYIENDIFNVAKVDIVNTECIRDKNDRNDYSVSQLIEFIPFKDLDTIDINFKIISENNDLNNQNYINNIKLIVKQGIIYENISSTIGDACSLYLELMLTKNINIYNKITNIDRYFSFIDLIKKLTRSISIELFEKTKTTIKENIILFNTVNKQEQFINSLFIDKPNDVLIQLLLIISEYITMKNSLFNNRFIKQIKYYNFLDNKFLVILKERLTNFLNIIYTDNKTIDLKFEIPCAYRVKDNLVNGVIDAIDFKNKIIIEIKFVNNITIEHFIQTIIYKYLIIKEIELIDKNIDLKDFKCYLFDVKSNNLYSIDESLESIENIIIKLIDIKKREKT